MLKTWLVTTCMLVSAPAAASPSGFFGKPVKVAWLGATPDNLYDAANLDGARDVAKLLHAKVTPFYSQFDPDLQLQQCAQVVNSGKYDAILVVPASSTGIIPCVEQAIAAGIEVVATDLPIGPDPTTTEPQVPGQIGAVLTPGAEFANSLNTLIPDACADTSPCRIVYLGGLLSYEFEQASVAVINDLVAADPDLEFVGPYETFYDPDVAYSIIEGLLADDVEIDLVIAAGDQMAMAAEWAIADAGVPDGTIRITGGGTSEYGVQAVRDGRWYATYVSLPYDEGALAAWMVIRATRGLPIGDNSIDPVELRGFPRVMTADNLDEFGCFEGQWPG